MRLALLAGTFVLVLGGCGSSSSGYGMTGGGGGCTASTATATTSVSLSGMAFNPDCIKVATDATVTFTNHDGYAHTVTADAGQSETFDSGDLASGASYQHTFSTAGTFGLHCSIHAGMVMTVVVQ